MNTSDHNHWSEDLAAYVLGALDTREATLERHLEGCEHCQEELRWLQPAVQTLPESVERQEPPPRLRESLMAEVRADAGAGEAGSEAKRRRFLPGWLRGDAGSRRLQLAAGFAVLVIAIAAVAGYEVGREGSDPSGAPEPIVFREDGVVVKMVPEGKGGTLHLSRLDQPQAGKVLEAWVLREGEVEAVRALFVPDRHGRAETRIADMGGVEEVMITEEPQGGSEAPTGDPIVDLAVPQ
jgi:hypothetical protein